MTYANHLRMARSISRILDNKFKFMGFRFGIDPILGLIPGIGDFVPMFFSLYLIWVGTKYDLEKELITKMMRNVVLDLLISLVPILGDIADFTYKASTKNYRLLESGLRAKYKGLA